MRRTTVSVTLAALLCCAVVGWPAGPQAAPLGDPTRPPGLAATPAEPAGPARRAATPRHAAPAASAAAPGPAPQLQSVQLPRTGAPSALVDGQLLRVGDRLGERSIVAIDAQGLLLRNARGQAERLDLLSGVTKHAVGAAPPSATVQASRSPEPPAATRPPGTPASSPESAADSTAPLALAGRAKP